MQLDLALVMPVYNEEGCIIDVIDSWLSTLSQLDMSFKLIVLNDGSTDNTADTLHIFNNSNHVEIINKKNQGHGPTILEGYRRGVEQAEWIFQCDSDDEMKAEHFPVLWQNRDHYDALFGVRTNRDQNLARKIISSASRLTVKALYGSGISDVNTPYRLMRSKYLKAVIEQIPPSIFAPNIIISGTFSKAGLRIYEHPVPHENRQTGSVSIMKWKLWKAALKSFSQTLLHRPRLS